VEPEKHRELLLATWTGLHKIEHLLTADKISALLKKENLLAWIVRQYFNATPEVPCRESVDGQFAIVYKGAPKVRDIVLAQANLQLRYKKKVMMIVTVPAQLVLFFAVIRH